MRNVQEGDPSAAVFWRFLQKNPELKYDDKDQLRNVYNAFFKPLHIDDVKLVGFSSVVYSLRIRRFINVKGMKVTYLTTVDAIICDLCGVLYKSGSVATHNTSRKHRNVVLQQRIDDLEKDKGGIRIQNPIRLGVLKPGSHTFNLNIENLTAASKLLSKISLEGDRDHYSFDIKTAKKIPIPPHAVHKVKIMFRSQISGSFRVFAIFKFNGFSIGRYITADIVDDPVLYEQLKPTAPYQKRWVPKRPPKINVIPGEPPVRDAPQRFRYKPFPLPAAISREVITGIISPTTFATVQAPLNFANYQKKFHLLEFLEEAQMAIDIRNFDMHDVTMIKSNLYLRLKVPGLAEKRPSVLYGDKVYVSIPGEQREYEGYVHRVQKEELDLKFHAGFHRIYIANMRVDVRFSVNRTVMKRVHQALDSLDPSAERILFPIARKFAVGSGEFQPFNRNLNARQVQAVRSILQRRQSEIGSPYVIFGPPGTGKTITLVEAVLQVRSVLKGKILICAPSNSAADLIVERLSSLVNTREMIRLNSFSRDRDSVSGLVFGYSHFNVQKGIFEIPEVNDILKKSIVVATCATGAILQLIGVPRGAFTHIFIDEAGHATEPETIGPIAGMATSTTQIILAGDPKQLGPIIRSPIVKNHLELSLLERLVNTCILYEPSPNFHQYGGYDPAVITKLVENYRSHPAILKLPSDLFYGGDLVPKADLVIRESMCKWEELNNSKFPILFCGVKGKDEREGNSPSWFNIVECLQVLKYIQSLQAYRHSRISLNDIGVVTPYRKQAEKIRTLLSGRFMDGVKVGSVEEFQGQERRVIIISTVRSSQEFIESDVNHSLGFLVNPKRFNVAITRAVALLVVIGNPMILCKDSYWSKLISYCQQNGSYTGIPFDAAQATNDDLVAAFKRLTMENEGSGSDDSGDEEGSQRSAKVSQKTQQENPEWRSEM